MNQQQPSDDAPAPTPPPADAPSAVRRMHRNTSHWYNNASFSLPLLGGLASLFVGLIFDTDEARGFGVFLLVVAAIMAPFIVWTWLATPTAIVVTRDALISTHGSRELKRLPWAEVVEVERKETFGNIRWRVLTRQGEHIAIEGEIEDIPALIAAITTLSGSDEEVAEA